MGELSNSVSPLSTPQGESLTNVKSDTGELPDETERRKKTDKIRKDAAKKKAEAERNLKSLSADVKWKEADLKRLKKDEIPNKRNEIDALNKIISTRTAPQ
jgi:hypothetical protein